MRMFKSYVMDAQEAEQEAMLQAYCAKEGMDYAALSDFEKGDLLEFAMAGSAQEVADNSFGGVGA